MPARIPIAVQENNHSLYLANQGFARTYQGKTRDMYQILTEFLVVASDRISIFDFVLNATIPFKGEVLTALTHFWFTQVLDEFPNHLVNSEKYLYCNAAIDLQDNLSELDLKRSLIVSKVNILPYEFIFRHHIGGSVFKKYQETGMAGGQEIPRNLQKWSRLERPIFTPSTKAETGHDVNIDAASFLDNHGEEGHELVKMLADAYAKAYTFAKEKGILILDTKLEADFGIIADEILTPDSSRFCDKEDWEQAMHEGREPNFFDKQFVREWGAKIETPFKDSDRKTIIGLKGLDPENDEHIDYVHSLELPREIIRGTTQRYLEIFERLTGVSLSYYQEFSMGIKNADA